MFRKYKKYKKHRYPILPGWHILTSIDVENKAAICSECGIVPIRSKGRDAEGRKLWRCGKRYKFRWADEDNNRHSYRKFKRSRCAICGFRAKHPCQLDVHHKDGNHNNNERSNLDTVCANCHRLIHFGK